MLHPTKKLPPLRKFSTDRVAIWDHHRTGWKCASRELMKQLNSKKSEVQLIQNADLPFVYDNQIPFGEWVGFLHAVVHAPDGVRKMVGFQWDMSGFMDGPFTKDVLEECRGLFTFSEYTADTLRVKLDARGYKHIPVSRVTHPTDPTDTLFNYEKFLESNKKIILIGQWMRCWQAMFDLPVKSHYKEWPAGKYILTGADIKYHFIYETFNLKPNKTVKNIPRVTNASYDKLLESCVVFLPLYDANACNTLIECIDRNTPVVVNRLPAIEEYIGSNYPLLIPDLTEDSIELASEMFNDMNLIKEATDYLANMDKERFYTDYFIDEVIQSKVYNSI